MTLSTIRLGGVPEHFNLPIHLAREAGAFAEAGIDLQWTDFGGGTGQMTRALRENAVDLCVLLTEGIIADIIRGNSAKIISVYVQTPLTWGIHTHHDNALQRYDDIFAQRYAISRFGSGSHLMAIVDAHSKGYTLDQDQFVVIKNLEGALRSLTGQESDVFYWEKFTTKPYVDAGRLRRVGEFLTPWPCFVVAATDRILASQSEAIIRLLGVIHQACADFMREPTQVAAVSRRYQQQPQDAARWYHSTEWATHGWVSNKMLSNVVFHLQTAGIIPPDAMIPELVWRRG